MDEGGESACWLDRVCPECGRLRERPGPGSCENCGAAADRDAAESRDAAGLQGPGGGDHANGRSHDDGDTGPTATADPAHRQG